LAAHEAPQATGVVKQTLAGELLKHDHSGKGVISQEAFMEVVGSADSAAVFRHLKINQGFFCELAGLFYTDINSKVAVKALLELLLLCRGDQNVSVDLLAVVVCFLNQELVDMENRTVAHLMSALDARDRGIANASSIY
jgi:hypothetical protein